jgi:hypothetical protein
MTDRRLTDAQIARALRAHLPTQAAPGLGPMVRGAAASTRQRRQLPSLVGWLDDTGQPVRQRTLLMLVALLLLTLLIGVATVGAQRFLERKTPDLDLTDSARVAALVGSTYTSMPLLPPMAITALGAAKERIYVDRSGAVRFDYFATRGATSPERYRIVNGTAMVELVMLDGSPAWVEQPRAISEDPRVFVLAELEGNGVQPGCEVTGSTSGITSPVGWSFARREDVNGRPAYHVTCGGGDLWIDEATRLILRSTGPARPDGAFGPAAGAVSTLEVTELDFGDQRADLFEVAAPPGVPSMTSQEFDCRQRGVGCTPLPTAAQTLPAGYIPGPIGSVAPLRIRNGWIAYSTDGPSAGSTDVTTGSDLYVVREGAPPALIAGRQDGTTRNACPVFSPDGTLLAYGVSSGSVRTVVVRTVALSGVAGERTRISVSGGGSPVCVRWSADGTRVAYLDGGAEVVRTLDGSTVPKGPGDPDLAGPAGPRPDDVSLISPSGEFAARIAADVSGCRLVVSRPNGTDAHVITLTYCPYAIAAWSPDATRILLMQDVSGADFAIHALAVDSGADTVVVSPVRTNGGRSWAGRGDVSWQPVGR